MSKLITEIFLYWCLAGCAGGLIVSMFMARKPRQKQTPYQAAFEYELARTNRL